MDLVLERIILTNHWKNWASNCWHAVDHAKMLASRDLRLHSFHDVVAGEGTQTKSSYATFKLPEVAAWLHDPCHKVPKSEVKNTQKNTFEPWRGEFPQTEKEPKLLDLNTKHWLLGGWTHQPIWQICSSQIGNVPQVGVKIRKMFETTTMLSSRFVALVCSRRGLVFSHVMGTICVWAKHWRLKAAAKSHGDWKLWKTSTLKSYWWYKVSPL